MSTPISAADGLANIYHITHHSNLPKIIQDGGLRSDAQCRTRGIQGTGIGYAHIKERRMRRSVPLPPKGVLGNYVPFYFAPKSPMLYTINQGNTDYRGGQRPVVHLVSSTDAVLGVEPELEWMFTEGHAEIAFSKFFDDLKDLNKIDWQVMGSKYWRDTVEDNDRKRRRQAEFLVHEFFPWTLVREIGVYDAATATLVKGHLQAAQHKPTVTLKPSWYY